MNTMARSAEYDPEEVIQTSVEHFRSLGYTGSSIESLVTATGLNRHSLYGAFGGKEGLFLKALEQYMEQYSLVHLDVFRSEVGLPALEKYFDAVFDQINPNGCLVVNTVLEVEHLPPEFKSAIRSYYRKLSSSFSKAIAEGQAAGEIRADMDPNTLTEWLIRATQGIAVSAKVGFGKKPTSASILGLLKPQ